MANFKTHLMVATAISGSLAVGLLITDLATPKASFFYILLGTLGGMLPDLDSPYSIPAQLFFTVSSILLAFLITMSQLAQLSWPELFMLGGIIYVMVYHGLSKVLAKLTTHRGNFHSILAALWFGLATTAFCYQVFGIREFVAWLAGTFVTVGYLVHLLLDEIYSVDLANRKLKSSFGSALKIVSLRYKLSTIFLILMTVGTFWLTPGIDKLVKIWHDTPLYQTIKTQ